MTDLAAALDLPELLGPVLGLGASGALLAVGGPRTRRRVPWVATPLAPLPVLAGLLALAALGLAAASGTALAGPLRAVVGGAAALGCVAAGWTAAQLWRHVELLATATALDVDVALGAGLPALEGQWVVLRGVLGAAGMVRSPGGVPCAFYEAELRSGAGRAALLLSREQAASRPIALCGARARVQLAFSPQRVAAPLHLRRTRVEVDDGPRLDVLSWESVGALGANALAIGRLERRGGEGAWCLVGGGGGPAPLVFPGQREAAARTWRREARRWIAVAVPLAVLAALCLGRTG